VPNVKIFPEMDELVTEVAVGFVEGIYWNVTA
jgi:hypothetical protein